MEKHRKKLSAIFGNTKPLMNTAPVQKPADIGYKLIG